MIDAKCNVNYGENPSILNYTVNITCSNLSIHQSVSVHEIRVAEVCYYDFIIHGMQLDDQFLMPAVFFLQVLENWIRG